VPAGCSAGTRSLTTRSLPYGLPWQHARRSRSHQGGATLARLARRHLRHACAGWMWRHSCVVLAVPSAEFMCSHVALALSLSLAPALLNLGQQRAHIRAKWRRKNQRQRGGEVENRGGGGVCGCRPCPR